MLVEHREAADLLLRRLGNSGKRTNGMWGAICAGRIMGAAAVLLNKPEDAKIHYNDALTVANGMEHRPEIALTRFQLAELQLEHFPDEKAEAIEHLDFAIDEFKEMKMQPSLEKAEEITKKYGLL